MSKLNITIVLAFLIAAMLPANASAVLITATVAPATLPIEAVLTPQQSIVKYATVYAVPEKTLLLVAKCESTFNPKAWNKTDGHGGSRGLFQFQQQTFNNYSKKIGLKGDIWNADDSAHVAAYMFSTGQAKQWSCYTKLRKSGKI